MTADGIQIIRAIADFIQQLADTNDIATGAFLALCGLTAGFSANLF